MSSDIERLEVCLGSLKNQSTFCLFSFSLSFIFKAGTTAVCCSSKNVKEKREEEETSASLWEMVSAAETSVLAAVKPILLDLENVCAI